MSFKIKNDVKLDDLIVTTLSVQNLNNSGSSSTSFTDPIAIGTDAGFTAQSSHAIAIGTDAGQADQGISGISIGFQAGQTSQGTNSIALGTNAGAASQEYGCVAIGLSAGRTTQFPNAIAIGTQAGQASQGTNAIAIGQLAGNLNQPNNSIVISALTNTPIVPTDASSLYIAPIVGPVTTSDTLYYNPSTFEVTYGAVPSGGLAAYGYANTTSASAVAANTAIDFQHIGPSLGLTPPAVGGTTFTIITAGDYEFNFQAVGTPATGDYIQIALVVNGAILPATGFNSNYAATSTVVACVGSGIITLASGALITLVNITNNGTVAFTPEVLAYNGEGPTIGCTLSLKLLN